MLAHEAIGPCNEHHFRHAKLNRLPGRKAEPLFKISALAVWRFPPLEARNSFIEPAAKAPLDRFGSYEERYEVLDNARFQLRVQSWLRKFEQEDKWSFCLTAAIIAANRRDHEQTGEVS
ncbi:hypothetical protein [Bradyrhizobium sp. GM2.2]|uniref:hypothetical protein n=1 Tax=Bradyrhizobium sp. GM2.2 TaxID=3156358 RepID=UPI00339129A2